SVALEMLDAGAVSYLVKRTAAPHLVETVLRSARGERILDPEVSTGVIDALTERGAKAADPEREREAEAVRLVLADGLVEPAVQPIVDLDTGPPGGLE